MDRRKLEIIKLVKSLGYTIVSIERPRTSHFHVVVSNGKHSIKSIFPGSASDHRWTLNKKSELRRRFKEAD